jgi:hypothetical protein
MKDAELPGWWKKEGVVFGIIIRVVWGRILARG